MNMFSQTHFWNTATCECVHPLHVPVFSNLIEFLAAFYMYMHLMEFIDFVPHWKLYTKYIYMYIYFKKFVEFVAHLKSVYQNHVHAFLGINWIFGTFGVVDHIHVHVHAFTIFNLVFGKLRYLHQKHGHVF